MTVLSIGVNDVPYPQTFAQEQRSGRARLPRGGVRWRRPKPARRPSTMTTGDVADILEKKYSLFSMFTVLEGKVIEDTVEQAALGALENLLAGGPRRERFLEDADMSPIEEAFKKAIDQRAFDGRLPGVPTRAAMLGVNHRLAHPYARGNPERPSFLDTGLLQTHLKAWIGD